MSGGQESVYVVLDLDEAGTMPAPGSQVLLQGMETEHPTLQLADGTRLVGSFEETVGTQLILKHAAQQGSSHKVQLLCHTDKRIRFAKAAQPVAADGEAAEQATAAAAAAAGDGGEIAAMETQAAEQQQQQQQQGGPR